MIIMYSLSYSNAIKLIDSAVTHAPETPKDNGINLILIITKNNVSNVNYCKGTFIAY